MELAYFLTTLGLVPYLASRAFLPIFASALVARFGPEWAWLAELAGVQLLDHVPTWAVADQTLMILGIAALVEVGFHKIPELREMVYLTDTQLKAASAFALALVLAAATAPPLQAMLAEGPTLYAAGFATDLSFTHLWALAVAVLTGFAAWLRKGIYLFLMEIDEDDDLGLQKLLGWMEDVIGFTGVLLVVILPVLAVVVTALTLLSLYLLQRFLERQEEKTKVPCTHCAHPVPPCGLCCSSCGGALAHPRRVGWMGTIRNALVTDPEAHRWQLLAAKRCRRCGERLKGKRLDQQCGACSAPPFSDERELEAYLARLQRALPQTLLVLMLFGAVPLVGLVVGIIYYRLTVISSLRHYIPRSSRMLGRWTTRIVNLFLVCLQPIPIVGAFTLPAMCLVNFYVYRRLLRRQGRVLAGAAPVPAGA